MWNDSFLRKSKIEILATSFPAENLLLYWTGDSFEFCGRFNPWAQFSEISQKLKSSPHKRNNRVTNFRWSTRFGQSANDLDLSRCLENQIWAIFSFSVWKLQVEYIYTRLVSIDLCVALNRLSAWCFCLVQEAWFELYWLLSFQADNLHKAILELEDTFSISQCEILSFSQSKSSDNSFTLLFFVHSTVVVQAINR